MVHLSSEDHRLAMRLTFENYWPLIFLVIIPYLWWVRRDTAMDLSPKHLKLSTVLRSILVAGPRPRVDAAGSLQSEFKDIRCLPARRLQQRAARRHQRSFRLDHNHQRGRAADHAQFVAFGSNSRAFETVEELRKVQVAGQRRDGSVDQSETDWPGALDRALRSFAPNHLKRAVLISDGNENSGDIASALARLNRENVHVFTKPLESRESAMSG
jgi:hypothetical protein